MTSDIDIARAAIKAGFPAVSTPTAVAIALTESKGFATSSTSTHKGLWRLALADAPPDWTDPLANAQGAKRVFDRQGFSYWPSFRSLAYLTMMPRASVAAAAASVGNIPVPDLSIPNPLEPIQQLAEEARRGLSVVSDRDTWIRIGLIALGAIITGFAATALLLALSGKTVAGATKAIVRGKTP